MARFLVDESLPVFLADELISAGHEADHILTLGMSGASDDSVYKWAQSTGAIVITRDLDFADDRRFTDSIGVVVVRLRARIRARELVDTILKLVTDALPQLESLGSGIIILEPGRTRVRRR